MKTKEEALQEILPRMIALGEHLYQRPEIGYREFYAQDQIISQLKEFDIPYTTVAYTGVKATLDSGKPGPNIGLVAEFDAVPVPSHPYANKDQSYAAPACGHYAQLGTMLAVLIAIKTSGMLNELCGKVTLLVTPAEEFCDVEYRRELIKEGKVKHVGGKQHMISAGDFDDVDIVLNCHAMAGNYDGEVNSMLNGFLHKFAIFKGKPAHASFNPEEGLNALNAVNLAMTAINFLRETFRDEDHVRVHYYLPKGGTNVGTVPEETRLELFVRASRIDAMVDIGERVTKCMKAGAYAMGCSVTIKESMGFFPLLQDINLSNFVERHMTKYIDTSRILRNQHSFASGDIGDVSLMKPTIQTGVSGFSGTFHGSDFKTEDTHKAYEIPASYFLDCVYDLLKDGGREAKYIIDNFQPVMDKEEYEAMLMTRVTRCDRI